MVDIHDVIHVLSSKLGGDLGIRDAYNVHRAEVAHGQLSVHRRGN